MNKKLLSFIIFCIPMIVAFGQSSSKEPGIHLVYLGFYAIPNTNSCNQLLFGIHNNTNDTLYIPVKDIKVEVSRDGKVLKESPPALHNLSPASLNTEFIFFSTFGDPLKSIEAIKKRRRVVEKLKRNYALKLYYKNFRNAKMNRDFFLTVSSECIVLLPKETVNYSEYFFSENLNQTYTIKALYKKSNVFTIYDDDKGNQVEIKY